MENLINNNSFYKISLFPFRNYVNSYSSKLRYIALAGKQKITLFLKLSTPYFSLYRYVEIER
jgi:hypothetical protein